MSRYRLLSTDATFIRWCPETNEEVEVYVTLSGTWMPGEPGNHIDPPIPPGVEDVWAAANGRNFPLSLRERDHAGDILAGEVE